MIDAIKGVRFYGSHAMMTAHIFTQQIGTDFFTYFMSSLPVPTEWALQSLRLQVYQDQ